MTCSRNDGDGHLTGVGGCPSCACREFEPFLRGLLQCVACGLVVDQKIWDLAANDAMEREWFGEDYDPFETPWVRWFELWNNRRTLDRMVSFPMVGTRLLEVGVGSGSFLDFARNRGYQVTGCDLSGPVARLAERRYRVPVHHGPVSTLPEGSGFDVVVMNHVLEHVQDPVDLLQEIRKRMNRGGLLHLAVPNVDAWESWLPGWGGFEPYHLIYFRPESLRNVAERAGFLVVQVCTHESFSGWLLALLRTLMGTQRLDASSRTEFKKRRSASWIEHVYRVAMIVAGTAIWPMRKLQAALGKGDEAVLIATESGR